MTQAQRRLIEHGSTVSDIDGSYLGCALERTYPQQQKEWVLSSKGGVAACIDRAACKACHLHVLLKSIHDS